MPNSEALPPPRQTLRVAKPRARNPIVGASGGAPVHPPRGDAAMARDHTALAVATLVTIMSNPDAPATARVSAANAVLDRAWGKPRQDIEVSATGDAVAAIQRARLRVHRQRAIACADGLAVRRDG